jgi:hypothetical protein
MMRSARFLVMSGASALGLVACGGAGAPQNAAALARPAPLPSGPVGSSSPAAAPALAPSTAAASAQQPLSPFHVIGELGAELDLYSAGDRGFLISERGIELELVGDEIVQDPRLKRGLSANTPWLSVSSVGGRYPDAFWLATTQASGRSGFSSLWTWDGKLWRKHQDFSESYFIWGMEPWVGGRMLALEVASMDFDARFHVVSGDGRIATPQFQKAPHREFGFCITHLNPSQFRTLPSGEVIVAGQHCDPTQDYQELAVERWAPGAKDSTIDIMPGIHAPDDLPTVIYTATGLAVLSPTDMFLAGLKQTWGPKTETRATPYFAHFDGKTWHALPPPIPKGVRSMWTEPGGVIFATDFENAFWSRSTAGKWSNVPWPAPAVEAGRVELLWLWPHAPGDTWAVVESTREERAADGKGVTPTARKRFLLHTHPALNALPSVEAMERKDRSLRLPGPPVEWCETRFVLLYTLGRQAPKDYDYPATRKALQGHREFANPDIQFVEFEREGRRYFGARVPDFDVGTKLAKLVKDQVPGSSPELVCLDPLESRTLTIDFGAGPAKK